MKVILFLACLPLVFSLVAALLLLLLNSDIDLKSSGEQLNCIPHSRNYAGEFYEGSGLSAVMDLYFGGK